MNLTIVNEDALNTHVAANEMYFARQTKLMKRLRLNIALAAFMIVFVYFTDFAYSSRRTYSEGIDSPSLFLGIFASLLLIHAGILMRYLKQKKSILADAARQGGLIFGQSNISRTIITDSTLRVETPLHETEIKWEMFCGYSGFGNFILLHMDNLDRQYLAIDKSKMTAQQLEEFSTFSKARLKPFVKKTAG